MPRWARLVGDNGPILHVNRQHRFEAHFTSAGPERWYNGLVYIARPFRAGAHFTRAGSKRCIWLIYIARPPALGSSAITP